uniref:Major facilitator superfamily (MFS) profile domain-containing protein n=1 Tax=Phytophthora ramorum TaxID=164328 RepID=H3GHE3_PHYRM
MSELVTDELTRKRVIFCVTIAFCHILTAANAMLYYSSYILEELQAGNSHPVSGLSKEIWVGIAKLAGVCSAVAVVDRIGRRPLLLIGTSLMLISHFIFAVCFWTLSTTPSDVVQTIGEWNLYTFIFAWNLSWAPLMWVVCSEILPDEFRSIGMGVTFGMFWLGSALVNQTLLSVFHAFGTGNAFLLYTTLTAGSLCFVFFKVLITISMKLSDGGLSAAEQQLEEFECMLSMFPGDQELQVGMQAKAALEEYVAESYGDTQDLAFGREVPSLTLTCPPGYPEVEPMAFEVHCPQLSRVNMERLHAELVELISAACAGQEVAGLQLYLHMQDFLSQVLSNTNVNDQEVLVSAATDVVSPVVLGRRAIYFHHIIASNKRRVVKEWALELQLGGFSKIGWPGVVIVEGAEDNVQDAR